MALIAGVAVMWPLFDPPEMITPPVIMGDPIIGQTLRIQSVGTWAERPNYFTAIWYVDDIAVEEELWTDTDAPAWDEPGVNHGSLYLITLAPEHEGLIIGLEIVASNSAGEATSTRVTIGPIEPAEEQLFRRRSAAERLFHGSEDNVERREMPHLGMVGEVLFHDINPLLDCDPF